MRSDPWNRTPLQRQWTYTMFAAPLDEVTVMPDIEAVVCTTMPEGSIPEWIEPVCSPVFVVGTETKMVNSRCVPFVLPFDPRLDADGLPSFSDKERREIVKGVLALSKDIKYLFSISVSESSTGTIDRRSVSARYST
jgi:hypothetical protein